MLALYLQRVVWNQMVQVREAGHNFVDRTAEVVELLGMLAVEELLQVPHTAPWQLDLRILAGHPTADRFE
jgi:hypothetical protein